MFDNLISKLKNGSLLTLETTPSHSAQFTPIVEKIRLLGLDRLVDGFTTTDNPLAKLKYNSLFAAKILQDSFSKPAIATMSMRDRNSIALQSDLLGANEANVRAILALTGDPATMSDQEGAKGVFEADSTKLLAMISSFNSGVDLMDKQFLAPPKEIYPFAVINSHAKNPKTLLKKMQKKATNGALALISQPVYDTSSAKVLLDLLEAANKSSSSQMELILGFFPITKLRTAKFLYSNVPGIKVPLEWIEALEDASKRGEGEEYKVGFDLSKRVYEDLQALHPKIHLMSANQFELAKEIIL